MSENNEDKLDLNEVPIIDLEKKNDLAFNIWSTHSSTDIRNDRERPYDGQSWTDEGVRGKTLVEGLTMRDVCDCLVKAFLISSHDEEYLKPDIFLKCWNFEGDKATPTEFLLQKQKEDKFVSTKVETGNWRYQDVYKISSSNIDFLAVVKNMACEIEKMMGIYPNIQTIKENENGR